ncbi:hypothetical protein ABK040_000237 [Willaertia magna]
MLSNSDYSLFSSSFTLYSETNNLSFKYINHELLEELEEKKTAELVILVYCNYYLKQWNYNLFEILITFLLESSIGNFFLQFIITNNLNNLQQEEEEDKCFSVVKSLINSGISLSSYGCFINNLKINNSKLYFQLPSSNSVKKYHATISPFISYKLNLQCNNQKFSSSISPLSLQNLINKRKN